MDWVTLWALAVNEENASGGRVVTAPTNGAAGIIPAVLHYAVTFVPGTDDDAIVNFLLVAGRPGRDLSADRVDLWRRGRLPRARSGQHAQWRQVRWPRFSVVRRSKWRTRPRSAWSTIWASPAIQWEGWCRFLASREMPSGRCRRSPRHGSHSTATVAHTVSLDKVIKTMMQTGADMKIKYKETARGGLAVNIVEC